MANQTNLVQIETIKLPRFQIINSPESFVKFDQQPNYNQT